MKKNLKSILTLAVALSIFLLGCTKVENNYITVEYGEFTLNGKELLTTVTKGLNKQASTGGAVATDEYDHVFPTSYTAYFVSKETKGEFTAGQVVDSLEVVSGSNTIVLPKLNYDVYVTNHKHTADKWYTWNNAISQLPQTSDKILLYGKNNINYGVVTEGTVELSNPYAAVMIKNNQWINGSPKSYDTNQEYFSAGSWYILYIRNNNTNTKVPINIAGNPNTHYTLSRSIESNNIYQYTIDGSVPLTDGEDNFNVIVKPFDKVVKETIKLN